jgi:toxin CcdB
MSQFDVHINPSRAGRQDRPYVVILQTRFLEHLPTRVCAPLFVEGAYKVERRLNPAIAVHGRIHYFSPAETVTLPLRVLGKPVANVEDCRDKIVAALDLVFLGI